MNMNNLRNYVKKAKILQDVKDEIRQRRDQFEEQIFDLSQDVRKMSEDLEGMKNFIRQEAEMEYDTTQQKSLLGGIGIRVGKSLEYEYEEAFNWAKEHRICLALDNKAFEKIAKVESLDFVKETEKITVTFPKEIKLPDDVTEDCTE